VTARDRGSTLLFFPGALLVVVVLASITVDLARARLVQREADDAAVAAANDSVTAGLDLEALRQGGDYRLDPRRVEAVVAASVRVHPSSGTGPWRAESRLAGPRSAEVSVTGRSPLAFAGAIPGAPDQVTVRARALATAELR
jgi:hypothetical protein